MAYTAATVQLLSETGELVSSALSEPYLPIIEKLSDDQLREFHRQMVVFRAIDVEAANLQRQGQLALWIPSLGQEAAQVGQSVPMSQTAAGRYVADFPIERYGSFLLKAIHSRDGKVVAESMGSVALPYPLEFLKTTPDASALKQAAIVTGGSDQVSAADAWKPGDESIAFTQDLWPWVLLGMIGLFVLDLSARRVRLFGYRTIKFE